MPAAGERERVRSLGGGGGKRRGVLGVVIDVGAGGADGSSRTRCQGGGGGGGGLFDGAGVVVLVASQSGATGEGLLAVGVGALVWALAGVDASMAGQRAGITKGL